MKENTENFIYIGLMTCCPDCLGSKGNICVNQQYLRHLRSILFLSLCLCGSICICVISEICV